MSHATFPLPAHRTPMSMYTYTRKRTYYASAWRRSVVQQSQRITPLGHTPKPAHYAARPYTKASALRRSAIHQSQRITPLGHTPKPAHCVARPHTKASALRRSATQQNNKTLLLKPAHCAARPQPKASACVTHPHTKASALCRFAIHQKLYRASRVRRGRTTSTLCPYYTD